MSAINFHTKEISVKLVYYGPGLCGKTTTLHAIYRSIPENMRPQLVSLATEVDRTIFFDFLPFTAYRIREFNVRLQLYTVPGQVFYNATRKLVLNGVDGVVFVVDSQTAMKDSNLESLQNLEENLADLGMDINDVPMIIHANKRDLADTDPVAKMDQLYNARRVPFFSTVATSGEGVIDGLKTITQMVINNLIRKGLGQQLEGVTGASGLAQAVAPAVSQSPAQAEPEPPAPPLPPAATRQPPVPPQPPQIPVPAPIPGPPVAPLSNPPSASSTAGSLSEAVASAASGGLSLWPAGRTDRLGQQILDAIRAEQWSEVVRQADALLRFLAERWASSVNYTQGDPVAAFLLLRGTQGARYRSFANALESARAGRPAEREDAMAALVLALEAVW